MFRSKIVKKKSNLPRKLIVTFVSVIAISFLVFFARKIIKNQSERYVSVSAISKAWKKYDYQEVYNLTDKVLDMNPLNNMALVYQGFASFYLALSQLDSSEAQNYLDRAINDLRVALYDVRSSQRGQIEYILGKSYFYKNTISSYYYADSAIKYLEAAKEHGYESDDIYEYLGLSYAALNMTMESISAFTEALLVRESFSLLLSIGEQYYKLGQAGVAKQYLYRIINECSDDGLLNKSQNLLGVIYLDEGDYANARQTFESILKKNQKSADAYYGLGVIYEKQGDIAKARAEWRKALKINVNHSGAMSKITAYK